MYWLLSSDQKARVRKEVEAVATRVSEISNTVPHRAQIFPFNGRKDQRKAEAVIGELCKSGGLVIDPFAGSGTFAYGAMDAGVEVRANEWEPYTHRMSSAPWRVPSESQIKKAVEELDKELEDLSRDLYKTECRCGRVHVLDSLFFDRLPLKYQDVTPHERLGKAGENVTFRRGRKCPACKSEEKHFDRTDLAHLNDLNSRDLHPWAERIFNQELIENSRINLPKSFTRYGNLFPKRSQLALQGIWEAILNLNCTDEVRMYLQDTFLAILPQAKYKDYRSKSQDLHCPEKMLRETNLVFRFREMESKTRRNWLLEAKRKWSLSSGSIECSDFRDFLTRLGPEKARVFLTDPPWGDGVAYFERAQLYHPWIRFDLAADKDRLAREVVITDAPSRPRHHSREQWWSDMEKLFELAAQHTEELGYMAMYFRPIPAKHWLTNLNYLKFYARKYGFEPLVTISTGGTDPAMRRQQSAAYIFNGDLIFLMLRLPEDLRRHYVADADIDEMAFRVGRNLQERLKGPFSERQWRDALRTESIEYDVPEINLEAYSDVVHAVFERYLREVNPGEYLVKPDTPFNGQLFDVPARERLFTFVPEIIEELTKQNNFFSFDMFLLKLGSFVENGTRMLIQEIEKYDVRSLIEPYAVPYDGGNIFERRPKPELPAAVENLMELDPYDFEAFVGELFRAMGYSKIGLMGGSGDRGVDVAAEDPEGNSVVIQCKRYIGNVSAEAVQRLHSFAVSRKAKRKIVVTTSGFTKQAKEEASNTATELVDGDTLNAWVHEYMPEFLRARMGMQTG